MPSLDGASQQRMAGIHVPASTLRSMRCPFPTVRNSLSASDHGNATEFSAYRTDHNDASVIPEDFQLLVLRRGRIDLNRLNRLAIGTKRVNVMWTAVEDAELQRLAADGKTDDQISTILSRTAISCRMRRWKLRVRDDLTRQE
jgi:hypothetical protein